MHQPHHTPDIRTLCSHLFQGTGGAPAHSCGSPALRGESFCFYHHPAHRRVPTRAQRRAAIRDHRAQIRAARQSFSFPTPTSRDDVQRAANQILSLLAADQIDLRHASRLLATLSTVSRTFAP